MVSFSVNFRSQFFPLLLHCCVLFFVQFICVLMVDLLSLSFFLLFELLLWLIRFLGDGSDIIVLSFPPLPSPSLSHCLYLLFWFYAIAWRCVHLIDIFHIYCFPWLTSVFPFSSVYFIAPFICIYAAGWYLFLLNLSFLLADDLHPVWLLLLLLHCVFRLFLFFLMLFSDLRILLYCCLILWSDLIF